MSALVTGGTGYVGSFIVENLLASGYQVAVTGRHAPADDFFSAPVAYRRFDLDPRSDFNQLLSGIDIVVHAAFHHVEGKYRGGEGNDPEGFKRLNGEGTKALFKAAKRCGARRCVFLSSRAVYGPHPSGAPLTEDMECRPDTLYGEVKRASEKTLVQLSDDAFCGTSLRVTGVYGAARPGHWHKWQRLFSDFRAGHPIAPRAGTEVHGSDVAAAAKLLIEAPTTRVGGEIFNACDLLIDRRDLLALLPGENPDLPERAPVDDYNVMSSVKLQELGWRPGGMKLLLDTVRSLTAAGPILPETG